MAAGDITYELIIQPEHDQISTRQTPARVEHDKAQSGPETQAQRTEDYKSGM